MNLPAALLALRWLIRDTFRQSLASGLFWAMLAISSLCILFCLSVGVTGDVDPNWSPNEPPEMLPRSAKVDPDQAKYEGIDIVSGELSLAFGAVRVQLGRSRLDAIHHLELWLALLVADVAGLLLALIWTAGFLPAFLEPHAIAVLLAKPVPRWSLLLGKFLGVLTFVLFQSAVFVLGTWLALGLRTSIWDPSYLLCIPLLLLHFAIFFSFSTLLAVWSRSTVVCVLGSIAFWIICWGMNYGRHALVVLEDQPAQSAAGVPQPQQTLSPLTRGITEAGYWLMPKPADLGILLYHALKAQQYASQSTVIQQMVDKGVFYPELSVLASILTMLVILGIAAYQFLHTDY